MSTPEQTGLNYDVVPLPLSEQLKRGFAAELEERKPYYHQSVANNNAKLLNGLAEFKQQLIHGDRVLIDCPRYPVRFLLQTHGLPQDQWTNLPGYDYYQNLVAMTENVARSEWREANAKGIALGDSTPLTVMRINVPPTDKEKDRFGEKREDQLVTGMYQQLEQAATQMEEQKFDGVITVDFANNVDAVEDKPLSHLNKILEKKGHEPYTLKRLLQISRDSREQILTDIFNGNLVVIMEDTFTRDQRSEIDLEDQIIDFFQHGFSDHLRDNVRGYTQLVTTRSIAEYNPYEGRTGFGSANFPSPFRLVIGEHLSAQTIENSDFVPDRAEKLNQATIEALQKAATNDLGLAVIKTPQGYGKSTYLKSFGPNLRQTVRGVANIIRFDGRQSYRKAPPQRESARKYYSSTLPTIALVDEAFAANPENYESLTNSLQQLKEGLTQEYELEAPVFVVVFQPNIVDVPFEQDSRDQYVVEIEPEITSYRLTKSL